MDKRFKVMLTEARTYGYDVTAATEEEALRIAHDAHTANYPFTKHIEEYGHPDSRHLITSRRTNVEVREVDSQGNYVREQEDQ